MQHRAVLHEVPPLHVSAVCMLLSVQWAPTAARATLTRSAIDCLAAVDSLDSSLSASDSSNDASFAIHSRELPGEICIIMLSPCLASPLTHATAALLRQATGCAGKALVCTTVAEQLLERKSGFGCCP